MTDRLRVAVVGCGFQGRLHLEFLKEIDSVEVVAVCDLDETRLAAAADEYGVPARFASHEDLLSDETVDLITICTMPESHPEITLDALAAGAGVLCEKPMAADLEGALAMAEAAERTGGFLTIGYNLRYSTAAQAVRAFVDDGRLGRPVWARGSMLETVIPWWGPHCIREKSGGGALASTAVHMIDLLMWLAGNPRPIAVTASSARLFPRKRGSTAPDAWNSETYDVEDLVFGHLRFDSDFWMTVEGAWTWDEPGWECRFDLVGDRAQAGVEPLRFSAEHDGHLLDVTDSARGDMDFPSSIRRQLIDVVDALLMGRSPLVTVEQALEVQAVVDAFYRSTEEGREVSVRDVRASGSHPALTRGGRSELQ